MEVKATTTMRDVRWNSGTSGVCCGEGDGKRVGCPLGCRLACGVAEGVSKGVDADVGWGVEEVVGVSFGWEKGVYCSLSPYTV